MNDATMQSVAVVGCGYVGTALARLLVGAGRTVVGTTTTPSRVDELTAAGVTPRLVKIEQADALHDAVTGCDAVVLAVGAGRKSDYRAVYVEGARAVLHAAADTGVRRILYTSSTRVYGRDDGGWVDEASPPEPADEKGRLLLEAECVLLDGLQGRPGVSAAAVRIGGIHGPQRDLVARIKAAAGSEKDGGGRYLNLVHINDVVSALAALVDSPFTGVLNLCGDEPETRRELYDRVIAAGGLPAVRWKPDPGGVEHRGKRVRNDLIKKTLGLTLSHPTV